MVLDVGRSGVLTGGALLIQQCIQHRPAGQSYLGCGSLLLGIEIAHSWDWSLVWCQPVPVWWARAGLMSMWCSAPTDPLVEGDRGSRVVFWGETPLSLGVEMAS